MSEVSLKDRVLLFHLMQLPGQPQMMHMGTSYLVNDLAAEVTRLEAMRVNTQAEWLKAARGDQARIAELRAEREHLYQQVGEATGRIETDGKLIAELEANVAHRARQMAHDAKRIAELEAEIVRLTAEVETWHGAALHQAGEAAIAEGEVARLTTSSPDRDEDWTALAVDLRNELGLPPTADRHEITVAVWNLRHNQTLDTDELIGEAIAASNPAKWEPVPRQPPVRERLAQMLDTEADWMTSNPEKARQFLRAIPPDREHEITLWWNNPWGHWVISYEGRDWFRPTLEDAVSLIKETALHSDVPNAAKLLRSPAP